MQPKIEVREETIDSIGEYATISSAFRVTSIYAADDSAAASEMRLLEQPIETSYTKDYDALPDNRPADWVHRFDTSNWHLLGAFADSTRVGGAIVIPRRASTPDGERVAELWDLRVALDWRRHGVATALFRAAERWMARNGFTTLTVETQHINVPACRFYASKGCHLESVNRLAYPELPDEVQLIWRKRIASLSTSTEQ